MTEWDYIFDGLEAALSLERELGTRSLEVDRALLVAPTPVAREAESPAKKEPPAKASPLAREPAREPSPARRAAPVAAPDTRVDDQKKVDILFVHDRPLSSPGALIIAKSIAALGLTPDRAPVAYEEPFPLAKVVVVLGSQACRKWFPREKAWTGQWISRAKKAPLYVTYSPDYILRLSPHSPECAKAKKELWLGLKDVKRRIDNEG